MLALKALEFAFVPYYDFDDPASNRLLGLDESREACLCACSVHGRELPGHAETEIDEMSEDIRAASRMAQKEISYPAILEIHRNSSTVMRRPRSKIHMIGEVGAFPRQWTKVEPPESWPYLQKDLGRCFRPPVSAAGAAWRPAPSV